VAVNPADLPLLDAFASGMAAGWSANELDTDSAGLPSASGGQVLSASGGRSGYWGTTYTKPMGARIKIPTLPTSPMALWLVQIGNTATPTGYRCRYDPAGTADITVSRINAGGSTFLHGGDIVDHPISAGDEIAVTIDTDGTVAIHRFHSGAWSVVTSAVDTSVLSGPFAPGLEINDTTFRGDDFRGGTPTSVTVAPVDRGVAHAHGFGALAFDAEYGAGEELPAGDYPKARVTVPRGGAEGGGVVVGVTGEPPAGPSEAQFYQPEDEAAVIRVRRVETQGTRVSYKIGRITTPPATPSSDGFTIATTASVSETEVVSVTVPLPTNDDDYTLAVFGWDGSTASEDAVLVEAFGAVGPTPLEAGIDYAAATIVSNRPGRPHLRVGTDLTGSGDLSGTITTYDYLDGMWRVLEPSEDPSDPTAGAPMSGWAAGRSGDVVRAALPTATADRWLEWSSRVRPTP
jgi:hypothetical protein